MNAQELIAFANGLAGGALPEDVAQGAKVCLLDALGCAAFGADKPWSRIVAEEMAAEAGRGNCTAIAQSRAMPAPAAAMCNATAIHGFELDDLIARSIIHPAAAVVPAALAAGEAMHASGRRVLGAIVAGYEVMHRVGIALGVEPARRGFHLTSLVAPVGAAVAAGVAAGLSREQLICAIGLACSAAAGIKAFAAGSGGGMVKRLHLGRAAEAGVRMCQLARRGFTGPPFAIDGRFGLLEVYGGQDADPARLSTNLGTEWAIREVWFKVYPMCGWIQGAVQLLEEMRGPQPVPAGEVARVRIGVSAYAARNNAEPAPTDTMGAQYSLPYCAAVALTAEPREPDMYRSPALDAPDVRRLAERVEVYVDPEMDAVYPAQFGARVSLKLADGRSSERSVLDCRGTPADPSSQAELRAKFRRLALQRFPPEQVEEIMEAVGRIAELDSVAALTLTLRGKPADAKAMAEMKVP